MSKLIIPAAEIIGTPLTPEELKGILAGSIMGGACSCDWILTDYTSHTSELGYKNNETECSNHCKEMCDGNPKYKCARYTWHYAASGSGTGS